MGNCGSDQSVVEPKRERRPPEKVKKYGPNRTRESSWARDMRLRTMVLNALKDNVEDDDGDKEDIGKQCSHL